MKRLNTNYSATAAPHSTLLLGNVISVNNCRERRCIHKGEGLPVRRDTPDSGEFEYLPAKKKPKSVTPGGKRIGRPPKKYTAAEDTDSRPPSSLGGESVDTLDSVATQEAEFAGDGQDILVESGFTNKPLTELLRASTRGKQQDAAPPPINVSTWSASTSCELYWSLCQISRWSSIKMW